MLPRAGRGRRQSGVPPGAPPRPPVRMQPARASAELRSPKDSASMVLHLSPAEGPDYTSITSAVPKGGPSGPPLMGPVTERSGTTVRLSMNDFPVEFFPVKTTSALLELCTIHLVFHPVPTSRL